MGSGVFDGRVALDDPVRSHGRRRRYKGGTGVPGTHGVPDGPKSKKVVPYCAPRSDSGGTTPAPFTYEVGQNEPFPTKLLPGKFKVTLPRNRLRVP